MRILLIVVYYKPYTMSSANLIHDLAIELYRQGHEPIVLAPDENITTDTQLTIEEGIKVFRIHIGKIKSAHKILRAYNEIRLSTVFWKKGKQFFNENPCDLIIYYSPTIFWGTLVKKLKGKFQCPSYLILGDIFPQWAFEAGVLRKSLVYYYFKMKERQNYDAASIIRLQSPGNLPYFKNNGLDKKYQIEVIYNWMNLGRKVIKTSSYRSKFGLQEKFVFFYGGNLGIAQDIDNIVRLAERLKNEPSAYFLLVGGGSEVIRLKSEIVSRGLTNISIHKQVNDADYLSMLSEFDVGLISLNRNLTSQNFPGKLMDYMYLSKPILASINPGNDLKEMLEENNAGLVCLNGEDELFADYALRLLNDLQLRDQLVKNARQLLENTFSVTMAAKRILSHFESDQKSRIFS